MKPGDRVRVIRNQVGALIRNNGCFPNLKPGDEITIKDYIDDSNKSSQYSCQSALNKYGNLIVYEVDPNHPGWDFNFIPVSDVELLSRSEESIFSVVNDAEGDEKAWLKTHQCNCSIISLMRFGCCCVPHKMQN